MNETFEARVTKDSLVFSAAHFITFNRTICERLHGHNWRLDVSVTGGLDENYYVFDFIAMRDACLKIVSELDHKVLLPDRHNSIDVSTSDDGREVTATFQDRRWVFPVEDCAILPVENTTAELIAMLIGRRLLTDLNLQSTGTVKSLKVSVEENFGQWATVTTPIPQR